MMYIDEEWMMYIRHTPGMWFRRRSGISGSFGVEIHDTHGVQ